MQGEITTRSEAHDGTKHHEKCTKHQEKSGLIEEQKDPTDKI